MEEQGENQEEGITDHAKLRKENRGRMGLLLRKKLSKSKGFLSGKSEDEGSKE